MFKNIFKAAKNLAKSPVGQVGIGLLAPTLLPGVSPALVSGGIGLLAGAKPEQVAQGLALGALTSGAMGGKQGIGEFFKGRQPAQDIGGALNVKPDVNMDDGYLGENFINKAPVGSSIMEEVKKPGVLESLGLVVNQKVNPFTGEMMPVTNFFEKYAPLVKLGGIGLELLMKLK